MRFVRRILLTLLTSGCGIVFAADRASLIFQSLPLAQYALEGPVGQRVRANTDSWLLPAPLANPGIIQMFHLRDRFPPPKLVPWAGEFAGKYLISAVQALRMDSRPEVRQRVTAFVRDLIASQSPEGYLGPFPKPIRLKGNWDLWGHYHCMLGLLMWHELTGDEPALRACQRAADLACETFLGSGLRVLDAGSPEMNMAIIHGLGRLYRVTRDARYLELMREIEKDWESAGDYFRTGLAALEFFETPKPRWESLHDLQGLVELYRITGDDHYANAFANHWRSILRRDRRNTGGFSSGEQATGNPYAGTPIETCCTIAWMAMTIDMLQLTGDVRAADELELSLYNGAIGAQHPSGRWWTYNTPMDGTREASAHSIVFQARAGSPELNCCSVNGPRGIGSLSEWAVMRTADGLVVNYFGPGSFQGKLSDNTPVALQFETAYPLTGRVQLRVEPLVSRRFTLRVRIPGWTLSPSVRLNNTPVKGVNPGTYVEMNRQWRAGDRVVLDLDLRLRVVAGDRETAGRVSIYRGPLLLAFDQKLNDFDETELPPVELKRLDEAKELPRPVERAHVLDPWIVIDLPAENGRTVRVCDFASAGAYGTRYRSWLPAMDPPPPPVAPVTPRDGAEVGATQVKFEWVGPVADGKQLSSYELWIAKAADFSDAIQIAKDLREPGFLWMASDKAKTARGGTYYWKVVAKNQHGQTDSLQPPLRFILAGGLQR